MLESVYRPNRIEPLEHRTWYYKNDEQNWVTATWAELQERVNNGSITNGSLVGWEGLSREIPYDLVKAEYLYDVSGKIVSASSEEDLHEAASTGSIKPSTMIWGRTLPTRGITYASFQLIRAKFVPSIRDFIEMRKGESITILSGPNNSGKSLALKFLRKELGPTTNLLGCNRFYQIDYLSPATDQYSEYLTRHENFVTQLYQQTQNSESNDFPLPQILSQMKNAKRTSLLEICSEMLGEQFGMGKVDPDNEMTQSFITLGGQKLAIASTGTRLLLLLVGACLDDYSDTLLIDEPELGLSPRLQAALARFLLEKDKRLKYFPHLKQIFIATHSHLFLDHSIPPNNFIVAKADHEFRITQVQNMSTFHDLQFRMLGNSLEALFLPTAIVIVEGDSDYEYIVRLVQILFPDDRISTVWSSGEGDTLNKLNTIKQALGDLQTSPYRERILILVDKKHSARTQSFTKLGIPKDRFNVLDKNGIEYYYPPEILAEIFKRGHEEVISLLKLGDNTVHVDDIQKTKKELSSEVVSRLKPDSIISKELREKLIDPLRQIIGMDKKESQTVPETMLGSNAS